MAARGSSKNDANAGATSSLPSITPDVHEQDHSDTIDNIVPTRGYAMVPTVGLGGSAGSIPALQKFFSAMPAQSGMAFVVVLHLSPEHVSVLDSILQIATSMRVIQPTDGQMIEADTVYVIPPGSFLTTTGERLQLSSMERDRGKRVTVDLFFRSLADAHGANATAIVLSGADGDGALGLRRVKERGGLTITQEPSEAEHPSMPQTSIDTGMVDWVLPVEEMPARLVSYRENAKRLRLPAEAGPDVPQNAPEIAAVDENAMREILAYLRTRSGRDFSCYKRATIVRRISRRMQVNDAPTMVDYLGYLRTHPGEVGALQQDLLISVTNFFRDRESFAALEALIPDLFQGKGTGDAIRVWSAACATGEEAFSLGMLLLEHASKLEAPPVIQVFATDLAEDAIAAARDALYPLTIQADVSEERLRRFFTRETKGFRVRRELRECVLFAAHDLLRDAPFSRMDLITCRNLLIYLNPAAQKRVFETFHFALQPKGLLFVGSSESVEEESALWETLDKKHRIFRRSPAGKSVTPVPIGPETLTRAFEAQEMGRGSPVLHGGAFSQRATMAMQRSLSPDLPQISWEELHFKLLERFAPPSMIVTRDYDIVHVSQNAGRLLHFSVGEPSVNLLRVVNPMLRVELRAALFRAAQTNAPVEVFNVPIELDGRAQRVDIRVCPAEEIAPDYLLVVLDIQESEGSEVRRAESDEPAVRHLERENDQLKRRLRDVIEQYEASGEELKAGNEELQAMNEELRSSAEELETSREELQSINEELTTVNHELKTKVDELAKANSDFANLMAASGVATIFLDRDLKITRYTPAALNLFNLIETDAGRPLSDITHRLTYPELRADVEKVLSTLIPVNREVSDGNSFFLAQVVPYRTPDDHILGVVLSFVDITDIRAAQRALRESEERLRLVLENAREYAIFSLDLDRRVKSWNNGAERLLGYSENEVLGETADIIFTPEDRNAKIPEREAATAIKDGRAADERWHLRKDGTRFWGSGAMMAMRDAKGVVLGFVKIFCDYTEKRAAQQALEQSQADLWQAVQENERAREAAEAATKAKDRFLAMVSHELRTPLSPVRLGLSMLERRDDLPPQARETVAMIQRNIQAEIRLIDDLLELSRSIHGKLELQPEAVDLRQILDQAISTVAPDLEFKAQELQKDFAATSHSIFADPGRLHQVFCNLLKNAWKFTPQEGKIRVSTAGEDRAILVHITDTGIGFSPELAPRIFEAFSQGNRDTTHDFGGLGLGLAIAKAIVVAHKGEISASSAGQGKGATFTVRLPLTEDQPSPGETRPPKAKSK